MSILFSRVYFLCYIELRKFVLFNRYAISNNFLLLSSAISSYHFALSGLNQVIINLHFIAETATLPSTASNKSSFLKKWFKVIHEEPSRWIDFFKNLYKSADSNYFLFKEKTFYYCLNSEFPSSQNSLNRFWNAV